MENESEVYETEFQEGEEMGDPMTDDFEVLWYLSLKPYFYKHWNFNFVVTFLWDWFIIYVVMGPRVAILRFSCLRIFYAKIPKY